MVLLFGRPILDLAGWSLLVSALVTFQSLFTLLVYLKCSPPRSRQGLSGERPLRDVTLSSVLDPLALSSGRVVHLGRSLGSIYGFEALAVVHSFHLCWYIVPVLDYSYAEEVSPRIQPAMFHSQVVRIRRVPCRSQSVLCFLGDIQHVFVIFDDGVEAKLAALNSKRNPK